jgi:voltage-gated potassium channel
MDRHLTRWQRLIQELRHYYDSDTRGGARFRYALLVFDATTILFVVASSFLPQNKLIWVLNVFFGICIVADIVARFIISRRRLRELAHPATWADMASAVSFLAPAVAETAGFLRALRTVRLLHTYQLLARLRRDSAWFWRHEDAVLAAVHLAVFIFIMTGLVYGTQHQTNPAISDYIDALYFTVTTLTTTGFGDITLSGRGGRLLAIAVMILGVTLFLNLVRALLRPAKARFRCPSCGLLRHDPDAVHCKACGELLNIPDEGRIL